MMDAARLFLLAFGTTSYLLSHVIAQEVFTASRFPFPRLAKAPQFVTITYDDSITAVTIDAVKNVLQVKERNGCNIKATFYVSIQGTTKCELVNALRKGQNEIATSTFDHVGWPNSSQIVQAVEWLNTECGVPKSEMRGFRAPYLEWNQETLNSLRKLGFLYDSSVTMCSGQDQDNRFGSSYYWPFTYDSASVQKVTCDSSCSDCGSVTDFQANPGLWEIPLYIHYSTPSVSGKTVAMDYTGDVMSLLETSLQRRMTGNRAPLGIFLHASWMQTNGETLKSWVESVIQRYSDVHFVTNTELIEWMRNPTNIYQPLCEGQVSNCTPPTILNCGNGIFNVTTCKCDCRDGFCYNEDGDCLYVPPMCATGQSDPNTIAVASDNVDASNNATTTTTQPAAASQTTTTTSQPITASQTATATQPITAPQSTTSTATTQPPAEPQSTTTATTAQSPAQSPAQPTTTAPTAQPTAKRPPGCCTWTYEQCLGENEYCAPYNRCVSECSGFWMDEQQLTGAAVCMGVGKGCTVGQAGACCDGLQCVLDTAAVYASCVVPPPSTAAPTIYPTTLPDGPTVTPVTAPPSASPTDRLGCCTWNYQSCVGPGDCGYNPDTCKACGGAWVDEIPENGCMGVGQGCNNPSEFCCGGLFCKATEALGDLWSTCVVAPKTTAPSQQPTEAPSPPTLPIDQLPYSGIKYVFDELKIDFDRDIFLTESPEGSKPSLLYNTEGFMKALELYYEHGDGNDIYLGKSGNEDDQRSYTYGLVNLAAFLSQLLSENVKYNACSESTWNISRGGYPLRNKCGQVEPSSLLTTCSKDLACANDPKEPCACVLGKLNYELGKRAREEGRWSEYPSIDFCQDSEDICQDDQLGELKWLVAIQSWVDGVQSYNVEGWNYLEELNRFVDGGYTDEAFIDAVSSIVMQGCHNPPCRATNSTALEGGGQDRAKYFEQILDLYATLLPTVIENHGAPKTSLGLRRGCSYWAIFWVLASF